MFSTPKYMQSAWRYLNRPKNENVIGYFNFMNAYIMFCPLLKQLIN